MVIVGILNHKFAQVRVLVVNVLLLLSCICLSGLKPHMDAVASQSGEFPLNLLCGYSRDSKSQFHTG